MELTPACSVPARVLADPAFHRCLGAAAANRELVAQFDRLRRTNLGLAGKPLDLAIDLASGRIEADAALFVDFVFDAVYERLGPTQLDQLRS